MVNKKKLSDLEEDKELVNLERNTSNNLELEKLSIDDLDDNNESTESSSISEQPAQKFKEPERVVDKENLKFKQKKTSKENQIASKIVEQSNPKKEKVVRKYFKRNITKSFLQKTLGFIIILIAIDLVNHFMKFFDEVQVLNIENYSSIYLLDKPIVILIKASFLLFFIYFITPKEGVVVESEGLYCFKNSLTSSFVLNSDVVFVKWGDIKSIEQKHKFFELYFCFFDEEDYEIGMLNFCVEDEAPFFKFVKKYAGEKHPLSKLEGNLLRY